MNFISPNGCGTLRFSPMFDVFWRSSAACSLVVLLTSLTTHSVWAQSEEDRANARAMATQGVSAYNEGRFAESLDLFTRAETLLHAPPHVLYLARSAERLGQLVRAREFYLRLAREELPANAPQAFRDAQNQAREEVRAIESRLATVTIAVKVPPGVTAKVELDGKPVSPAVIGVPIPADPGKHQLTLSAPGYESQTLLVTLAEGGKGKVELQLGPASGVVASPPPTSTPAAAPLQTPSSASSAPAQKSTWVRPVSYAALGVGALGLGAGVYFGLDSRSNRKDADAAEKTCNATTNGCQTSDPISADITRFDDDARKSLRWSIISSAVGVVGIGAGTALLLLGNSDEKPPTTAQVTPWVGFGSVGLLGTW